MKPLYLIDAYALIYRSYFAFISRPLRNSVGKNISVLFGFARALVNLINGAPTSIGMRKPTRLAVVFDPRGKTFRHEMFPNYKANRQKTPDDLHAQVPLVEEFLAALGIPSLLVEGFEADDIIATLAGKCRAEGRECYILSGDKDLLQLVGEDVYELRPSKKAGENWEMIGPPEVKAEWFVQPAQMLDLLSLAGDISDNIPGVKGIGIKGATKLIVRYGSLEEIYKNIAGIEGATGTKLAEGKESAYFSRSLISLRYDVPLPVENIEALSIEVLNRPAGAAILRREDCRETADLLLKLISGGDKGRGNASANAAASSPQTQPAYSAAPAPPFGTPFLDAAGRTACDQPALMGAGSYRAILDIAELRALLDTARKQGVLALDFETDSLDAWHAHPIGISLAVKPMEAFYVPVAAHLCISEEEADTLAGIETSADIPADTLPQKAPFIDPALVREALMPVLSDPNMTIAAHNAKYDYKVSRGWGIPRWQAKIWDTMIAAWIIDPERGGYSLDSLAGFFLSYTSIVFDDIVPKGRTFAAVPLETAVRYSAEDADLCLRIKAVLEPRLQDNGISLFQNLEMPLLPILAEMEGAGIHIEKKALSDYGKELAKELQQIQDDTFKTVGHEFNLSSTQQLQKVLFEERGLKPGKKTKTGYSTDVAVLEMLASQDAVPALILRHRTLSKLKSTYVDALDEIADSEGRLHTSFVQTGTATGRLSSRDPNLQNIPIRAEEGRRIREAFVAKEGHLLISADYSQIELVVLAHLSEDENLIDAFLSGKDIHARTAALIFGIDEDDVQSDQRRIAKTINFGVMYGMSDFRLSNELNISRSDATAFKEAYFKTYAGINRFITNLITKTEQTGYAETIFGRKRPISAINSPNKTEKAAAERVAVNTPIQGSAADIVKTAMLNVDKALVATGSPARLLLQVHDELILEAPEAAAQEAAALVRERMENAVSLRVPLRVSVETGKRWGDFH